MSTKIYASQDWVEDKLSDITTDTVPSAVNTALAQAKASGEFNGEPGEPGNDYVLTEADKTEIAGLASEMVDIPEGGGFVAQDTPPENTEVMWIDTSDNDEPQLGSGATFIPTVSEDGVIGWTNDKGLDNPESVNIKGPKGDPGNDYILTESDKMEIATMAAERIEIPETSEVLITVEDIDAICGATIVSASEVTF